MKLSDTEFTKIMDMFEFLHAENLYMIRLILHLFLKKDVADKTFEEISKQWIEEYEKCRKKW